MAVEGDYLVFAGTEHGGSSDAQCIVIEDPTTTAAVLLELAKTVLQRTDDESSKRVLSEAGLSEGNSLRASSNDLKSLKVKDQSKDKAEGGSDEAQKTGKLTSTAIEMMLGEIPADVIRYFETKEWYVRVLNSSSNPAKAARTMMAKPKFEGQYQGWLKKNGADTPPQKTESAPRGFPTLCSGKDLCRGVVVVEVDGKPLCKPCAEAAVGADELAGSFDEDDGLSFNVEDVSISDTDGLD